MEEIKWKKLFPKTEIYEQRRRKRAFSFVFLTFLFFLIFIIYSYFFSSFFTKEWIFIYVFSSCLLIYCCIEPFLLKYAYYEVEIPNKTFQPIIAVHLTDIHIVWPYPYSTEKKLMKIVEKVNSIDADFIFLTGDYITRSRTYFGSCENADKVARALSKLKSKNGVFAVMGNNDLCAFDYLCDLFTRSNIKVLRQEAVEIGNVTISGIDTSKTLEIAKNKLSQIHAPCSISQENERKDFLDKMDISKPYNITSSNNPLRILLAHEPDVASVSPDYGFDLQLSGHSHGGQVSLPFSIGPILLPRMGKLFPNGLFNIKNMLLFVSPGIGISTLPKPLVRFNCRPEVSVLRIIPSNETNLNQQCIHN